MAERDGKTWLRVASIEPLDETPWPTAEAKPSEPASLTWTDLGGHSLALEAFREPLGNCQRQVFFFRTANADRPRVLPAVARIDHDQPRVPLGRSQRGGGPLNESPIEIAPAKRARARQPVERPTHRYHYLWAVAVYRVGQLMDILPDSEEGRSHREPNGLAVHI